MHRSNSSHHNDSPRPTVHKRTRQTEAARKAQEQQAAQESLAENLPEISASDGPSLSAEIPPVVTQGVYKHPQPSSAPVSNSDDETYSPLSHGAHHSEHNVQVSQPLPAVDPSASGAQYAHAHDQITPPSGASAAYSRQVYQARVSEQTQHDSSTHAGAFVPAHRMRSYSTEAAHEKQRIGMGAKIFLAGVAVLAAAVACWFMFLSPISITLNGEAVSVGRNQTIDAIVQSKNITATPGRLLAVDGSVLETAGGEAYSATLDGQAAKPSTVVGEHSDLTIGDGADVTEDYDETTEPIPSQWVDDGSKGAFHEVIGEAQDGISATRTGKVSGITVTNEVVSEPVNPTLTRYNVDTGGDKVIALTFDDGPWNNQTEEILDILDQNDAKATFFIVGTRVDDTPGGRDLLKRQHDSGHQICSHTWDHAAGSGKGVNLGYMSEQEQIDEITKGQAIISEVTGEEASKVIRTPGGNYSLDTARIIHPYVSLEMGWTVDSQDWRRPGADKIEHAILSVKPGGVILMHDGGGDRSQTIQALSDALPKLKEEGYKFVTIDELWAYHKKATN